MAGVLKSSGGHKHAGVYVYAWARIFVCLLAEFEGESKYMLFRSVEKRESTTTSARGQNDPLDFFRDSPQIGLMGGVC